MENTCREIDGVKNGEDAEKLVFLETFGCQMNDNDSQRMLGFLKEARYTQTCEPDKADLIIINTCSVRDKAEQKVYSTLGRLRELKKEKPGLIIGVSGCVAQQAGENLLKRAPHLDIVLGPHNIHKLKGILSEVSDMGRRVVATDFNDAIDDDEYGAAPVNTGYRAFVNIMRGCNNFCTYCIVPYTRGREVSRKSADILGEITGLVEAGVREVTLLGQNVNSYGVSGSGDMSFTGLLRKAASVAGLKRLRFITSHPKDISSELIGLFAEEPKLCRHIHLPVQSGSNRILKEMRRGYTIEAYLSSVTSLKELYPDISITSDIIVGFPGETESDFAETMELIEKVRFDNIFSFMYSPRPGTFASGLGGQLPADVKSERLRVLQDRQKEITTGRSRELIGKTVEVLVEGPSKAADSELSGRSSCNRIVNFAAPAGIEGTIASVIINDALPNSLRGRLVPAV